MKHFIISLFALLWAANTLFSQNKSIEMADVPRWKSIEKHLISNDGKWVVWQSRSVGEGDALIALRHSQSDSIRYFNRGENPIISENSEWLTFTLKPALDSVRAQKRRKVKNDDLPKDTLAIVHLKTGAIEKIARVKQYSMPVYWSGWLVAQLEPAPKVKEKPAPKDTSATPLPDSLIKAREKMAEKRAKSKKESADNGSMLLVRNLGTQMTDTIPFVKEFTIAERAPALLVSVSGIGDAWQWQHRKDYAQNGVYFRSLQDNRLKPLYRGKGKYKQLSLHENGQTAAFLMDTDTTKAFIRPWQLALAATKNSVDTAAVIAQNNAFWMPVQPESSAVSGTWIISEHQKPMFSKDESMLYFGIAPPPVVPDSTLLTEEVAKVEVWATESPLLHTAMKERLKDDLKRSWPVVCHLDKKLNFVVLADTAMPQLRVQFHKDKNSLHALATNDEPYTMASQWLGDIGKDVYAVDLKTGNKRMVIKGLLGNISLSPAADNIVWWSNTDTSWWAYSILEGKTVRLTDKKISNFHQDDDDTPDLPGSRGNAGFLTGEKSLILYDKYDLWISDIRKPLSCRRITEGYKTKTVYRYLRLDPEAQTIDPGSTILVHGFNETTKAESYSWLNLKTGAMTLWKQGPYSFSRSPIKAKNSTELVYSRQNLQEFPDLRLTRIPGGIETDQQISNTNPQQSEYAWPTIELIHWRSLTGDTLAGLLIKPAGFDKAKKYPMIVNFYEKLSDGLYLHRPPTFGRSQINYVQYASRGYVVFLPDIPYRIGYPGESAYNAVVSGTNAVIDQGGIDANRVALQGHSWGGYQIAYIVTKTNMFKCAEAGAAVVNMTSAYGGIRWETGVSRHFQYEKQQSRIGGTLWEKPMLYLENSPLFSLNKVETPLLLMHNDKDGAVPWEQGLEFFTCLRRLEKPAWLLNYNDEPHWPVKYPNRVDFQKRMQQFFDHYLMGAPEPRWMQKGIPPMEKDVKEK